MSIKHVLGIYANIQVLMGIYAIYDTLNEASPKIHLPTITLYINSYIHVVSIHLLTTNEDGEKGSFSLLSQSQNFRVKTSKCNVFKMHEIETGDNGTQEKAKMV